MLNWHHAFNQWHFVCTQRGIILWVKVPIFWNIGNWPRATGDRRHSGIRGLADQTNKQTNNNNKNKNSTLLPAPRQNRLTFWRVHTTLNSHPLIRSNHLWQHGVLFCFQISTQQLQNWDRFHSNVANDHQRKKETEEEEEEEEVEEEEEKQTTHTMWLAFSISNTAAAKYRFF